MLRLGKQEGVLEGGGLGGQKKKTKQCLVSSEKCWRGWSTGGGGQKNCPGAGL